MLRTHYGATHYSNPKYLLHTARLTITLLKTLTKYARIIRVLVFGAIAQLARAPALQAGGPEFESPSLHHMG